MAAIQFPPREIAETTYTVDPWIDEYGQQWLYNADKQRMTPVASATTGGGTTNSGAGLIISEAEPAGPYEGMQWLRTVDGVTYTRYDGFWVAGDSAPVPALDDVWAELDTKLSTVTEPQTVTAASSNMLFSQANAYLRFTHAAASKTYTVVASDGMAIGSTVTIRNAAANDLVITPESVAVTINGEETNLTVPANGTAQLIKIAEATWDLI